MPRRTSTPNGSAHCCFGDGRGEGKRPPRPAGRSGQGNSRCPALRDRSQAGLPCSASGKERLPREHHRQLPLPAGREALSRPGCRGHDPASAMQAGRALGPCSASRNEGWPGHSPGCRARARMARSLSIRLSVLDGPFARHRCEPVIGLRRGWCREAGADLSCVFMYQAGSSSTGRQGSKGTDEP